LSNLLVPGHLLSEEDDFDKLRVVELAIHGVDDVKVSDAVNYIGLQFNVSWIEFI
jgi:hypothetical protein